MNQDQQEKILEQNTKLLRRTLLMPQQTVFETCKRLLESFVKNGVYLFNKWCQKNEPQPSPQQTEASSPSDESSKPRIKYSFEHFEENNIQDNDRDVEKGEKDLNKANRTFESCSDDPENSKLPDQEQSFEARFKRGGKRIKRDPSESSFQQENKTKYKIPSIEERQFLEAISLDVFLEVQKKLIEAKKNIKGKNDLHPHSKYKEYLARSASFKKLSDIKQTHLTQDLSRFESNLKREQKNLRKKVLFEDESHQLYDLTKVYESLQAEKVRREEHRRYVSECKRREQEQKLMMEKLQMQRKLQAQRKQAQQAIRRQKEHQQQELKLAAQAQRLAQQRKAQQQKNQIQKPNESLSASIRFQSSPPEENNDEAASISPVIENPPKSPVIEKKSQPSLIAPFLKQPEQKKQDILFGTPNKQKNPQESKQTPLKQDKAINPFICPPTKTLNMQDLINHHKPSTEGLFPPAIAASPPRSNIFNAPQPVNNLFKGNQPMPSISPSVPTLIPAVSPNNGILSGFSQDQPQSQPIFNPVTQTPINPNPMMPPSTNPMIQLSSYFNSNTMMNNSPGANFFSNSSVQGAPTSGGPNPPALGFNSSSSSSFLSMSATPFNKSNLFMEQAPQATAGLFGPITTQNAAASSRPGPAGRKKQQQIRIS